MFMSSVMPVSVGVPVMHFVRFSATMGIVHPVTGMMSATYMSSSLRIAVKRQ